MSLVGAGQGGLNAGEFQQFRRLGGGGRHSAGVAGHRYELQIPPGNGAGRVRDPAMRSEILKLRNDPAANALMAGAFTKSNASALSERLGREPSEGELYI